MLLDCNDFKSHWAEGIDACVYHSDKSAVNSSALKLILKSPATFYANFFDGKFKKTSKELEFGKLVHQVVLEGSDFLNKYIIMPDFGDFRSPKNRAARDEWIADHPNNIIVTQEEMVKLEGISNSLIRHTQAFNLLKGVKVELTGYFSDPLTKIKSKIRPDFLSNDGTVIGDIKTTKNIGKKWFARDIVNYMYHLSMAMYYSGSHIINRKKPEFCVFIALEKEPPYEVAVYVADDTVMDGGHKLYRSAMEKLSDCIAKNVWPPYQTTIDNIGLPHYAIQQFNDEDY